ncbi:MAG: cytochrome c5 family protein [Betaproteobacteria bacterium HGW-Betaproteobacteria-10]|nr:MAG: cytochrome c5 family protein [Betaproteobacteria bacterium HGW-Betaproteobacteria-10]
MSNNKGCTTGRATTSLKAIALIAATACSFGLAQATERSGKDVVNTVCATCHSSGKDGAPKIGDQADWSKRAAKGLASLTEHAITGVRNMPAHGGQAKLSDIEMSRAVAYMVSGGHSVDTHKAYASPQSRSGAEIVQLRCQECHATGKDGSPKIGDMSAWQPRLKNGVDPLVKSAINGHNSMPARGGMADLSDAEMRSAVTHMINQLAGRKK